MTDPIEIGKIQTFSLVAGSRACNARCPYCVSKMTPEQGMSLKADDINWDRFRRGYEYAAVGKAEVAMITGKGEPTLFPDHISGYLNGLLRAEKEFPGTRMARELQTNGIEIADGKLDDRLYLWRTGNLHLVAISVVHHEPERNREVFSPYREYPNLSKLIDKLHQADYSVRLACVLLDGFIDSAASLEGLIRYAKDNHVEQVTIRPVSKPNGSSDSETAQWVDSHFIKTWQLTEIMRYLENHGTEVRRFTFGGVVYSLYDIGHQNVCITNSLTKDDAPKQYARQIIFYPSGRIATDWTEQGEGLV